MKDWLNGSTFCMKAQDPFSSISDEESGEVWEMSGWLAVGHRWRSPRPLVCLIKSCLVWRRGEGHGGCCSPVHHRPQQTKPMFLWSIFVFTIDSSLNNHCSQLDVRWVDPAGPLIAQSIDDHKIPLRPPEGSISIKNATLPESQYTWY